MFQKTREMANTDRSALIVAHDELYTAVARYTIANNSAPGGVAMDKVVTLYRKRVTSSRSRDT